MYAVKLVLSLLVLNSYFCIGENGSSEGESLANEVGRIVSEIAKGFGITFQMTTSQTEFMQAFGEISGRSWAHMTTTVCQSQSENFDNKYDKYGKVASSVCDKVIREWANSPLVAKFFDLSTIEKTLMPKIGASICGHVIKFLEKMANVEEST